MKKVVMLFLKGMAMGAADVVPGVSGGTIAFISGIYDELLRSLARIPEAALQLLRGRVGAAWQTANCNFLLILFAGVLTSIFSLARLITWLLEAHPIPLWSFFFGLILISTYLVGREISRWHWSRMLMLLCGTAFAFWITVVSPIQLEGTPLILFFAGALAICAMILPGISGSFILLILGLYAVVLAAVKSLDLTLLAVFAAGCVIGLLCFARILSWLLERLRDLTLAFLCGLMLGSLNKVWPWKQTLEWQQGSDGRQTPLVQQNLLPHDFALASGQDSQLALALVLAVCGVLLVWVLERFASARRVASNEF